MGGTAEGDTAILRLRVRQRAAPTRCDRHESRRV